MIELIFVIYVREFQYFDVNFQVWRIESCKGHFRAISRGPVGRYYSIPLTHPAKFVLAPKDGKHKKTDKGMDSYKFNVIIIPCCLLRK